MEERAAIREERGRRVNHFSSQLFTLSLLLFSLFFSLFPFLSPPFSPTSLHFIYPSLYHSSSLSLSLFFHITLYTENRAKRSFQNRGRIGSKSPTQKNSQAHERLGNAHTKPRAQRTRKKINAGERNRRKGEAADFSFLFPSLE